MSDLFLTELEVEQLTGYVQAAKQVAHLKAQKIPFHTNRCGQPRVARAVLEGGRQSAAPKKSKEWSPAWAANLPGT